MLHQICSDTRFFMFTTLLVNPLLTSDNTRSELSPGHICACSSETYKNFQKPALTLWHVLHHVMCRTVVYSMGQPSPINAPCSITRHDPSLVFRYLPLPRKLRHSFLSFLFLSLPPSLFCFPSPQSDTLRAHVAILTCNVHPFYRVVSAEA